MAIGITGANNGYSRNAADVRFAKSSDGAQSITANTIYLDMAASSSYVIDSIGLISRIDDVRSWSATTITSLFSPMHAISDMAFSADGLKLFIGSSNIGLGPREVYDYELSTAFDISTLVTLNTQLDLTASTTDLGGVTFSSDGSRLFIADNTLTGDRIDKYELAVPWDLNSVGVLPDQSINLSTVPGYPSGAAATSVKCIQFSPDGNYLFILDDTTDKIYQIDLFSSWDLASMVGVTNEIFVGTGSEFESQNGRAICFNADGYKLFYHSNSTGLIVEIQLSSPYNIGSYSVKQSNQDFGSLPVVNTMIYSETAGKMYLGTIDPAILAVDIRPKVQIYDVSDNYVTIPKLKILSQDSSGDAALIVNSNITCQNITSITACTAFTINGTVVNSVADGYFSWTGRSRMYSSQDSRIVLTASGGSGFDLLQFGGTASGFPAIKRSGTDLHVRLANDGGFTNIEASAFIVNNNILTKAVDFTLAQTDAGRYMRLTKTGSTQTITLPTTGISTGAEFQFYRATTQSLAFAGSATVNGGVNLSAVSQNTAFALKYLGGVNYDFI